MTTYDRLLKVRQERGRAISSCSIRTRSLLSHFLLRTRSDRSGADGFLVGGSLMLTNVFEDTCEPSNKTVRFLSSYSLEASCRYHAGRCNPVPHPDQRSESGLPDREPGYCRAHREAERTRSTFHRLHAHRSRQHNVRRIHEQHEADPPRQTRYCSRSRSRSGIDRNETHLYGCRQRSPRISFRRYAAGSRTTMFASIIVGGGIRTPEDARKKVEAGASFVVTGTITELNNHRSFIREFADAVHIGRL